MTSFHGNWHFSWSHVICCSFLTSGHKYQLHRYVREGLILWAYLFLRTWTTVAAPLSQMNMKGQLHPLRTQFQANQAIINKLSN